MTPDEKAVVRRALAKVWRNGNLAAVDELSSPDFVGHQHSHPRGPRDVRGVEQLKAFAAEFRAAFPEFRDTVQAQVAAGDRVVTRFTSAGTQQGEPMGNPPTHRPAKWAGISIDRVVDGKIVENWVEWEMLRMLQQLGVVDLPG